MRASVAVFLRKYWEDIKKSFISAKVFICQLPVYAAVYVV